MTAPSLDDYQYQFTDTGIVIDPNTQDPETSALWDLERIEGLDMPEIRLQEQDRDGAHGSFAFAKYTRSRAITITGAVRVPEESGVEEYLDSLKVNYAPSENPLPFYYKHPNVAQKVINCNSLGVRYPVDIAWNIRYVPFQILLIAEDPRAYGPEITVGPVGLPVTSGGMSWPMTFNFGPTTAQVGGHMDCYNSGNSEAYPVITINDAVQSPRIKNLTTGNELTVDYTLKDGDQLVLDTRTRTLYLNGGDRTDLVSQFVNKWPLLAVGENTLQFHATAYSATADATTKYRSVWL
jgi:hypothetical protein